MSGTQQKPWSDNPNAPEISHKLYVEEKAYFAGALISAILYGMCKMPLPIRSSACVHFARFILGIVIVLFFQCMAGLLNSLHRRMEGIKWGIISYTLALFSFVTVYTAMNLNIESVSYIDNRDFPGVKGMLPPGPLGYRSFIYSDALSITPNVMFFLNNWLADAFLVSSSLDIAFVQPGV